jgi:hypothetical protein
MDCLFIPCIWGTQPETHALTPPIYNCPVCQACKLALHRWPAQRCAISVLCRLLTLLRLQRRECSACSCCAPTSTAASSGCRWASATRGCHTTSACAAARPCQPLRSLLSHILPRAHIHRDDMQVQPVPSGSPNWRPLSYAPPAHWQPDGRCSRVLCNGGLSK